MPQNDDEVVEPVLAPQPFMRCGERKLHRHVVLRVLRIVAPSHGGRQRYGGKRGGGKCDAVRTVVDPPQRPVADGRRHIALALV